MVTESVYRGNQTAMHTQDDRMLRDSTLCPPKAVRPACGVLGRACRRLSGGLAEGCSYGETTRVRVAPRHMRSAKVLTVWIGNRTLAEASVVDSRRANASRTHASDL